MSDRTRGIIVQPVKVPEGAEFAYGPYYSHVIAQDHTGQWYIICEEGVGRPITDAELAQCTYTTDMPPVDLADFVRTFGSRLETNHYMWVRKLGGTYVITGKYRSGKRIPAIRTQHPEEYVIPWQGTLWYETPDGTRTRIRTYVDGVQS